MVDSVKLCVPPSHLDTSASVFPIPFASSFCVSPFLDNMSAILSDTDIDRRTWMSMSDGILLNASKKNLLAFILSDDSESFEREPVHGRA